MGTITTTQISNGDTGDATTVDGNFDTIVNEFNGNIDNANIKASAAIDFSKLASAAWTTWSPAFTGFSVNPTMTARYIQIGKTVHCSVLTTVNGTSNATTFTMTLPVAAKGVIASPLGNTIDAGASKTTPGRLVTGAASATIQLFTDMAVGVWTNSGGKGADFVFSYEGN